MLSLVNGNKTLRIGQLLIKVGGVALGLVFALVATFQELIAASDSPAQDDRSIQDSDLMGDYNLRTQQFDAGTDPTGWYEDEH